MTQSQEFPRIREVTRIGQEINHDLPKDLFTLFENLKDHIGSIFGSSHSLLLSVYESQTKTLAVYQAKEGHIVYKPDYRFEGASQYIIANKTSLFIRQRSNEVLPFQIGRLDGTRPAESFIYVPLMLRGEVIGALSIQHPKPDAYREEDLFILELLANHVALAIRNLRLFKNLTLLSETGQLLTQQFGSPSALQAIVDNIKEATLADIVVLYPYKQTTKSLVSPPYIAGTLSDPAMHSTMHPRSPDDIAQLMLMKKEAIFAKESVQLYKQLRGDIPLVEHQRFYQREGLSSTAAIPLLVEGKNVGVLFINFRQPQRFDAKKLLIEGLAHAAAIVVKNTQIIERLSERRIHELETLQKIDSALNQPEPDLNSVLETILKLGHAEVAADHSAILILSNGLEQLFTFDTSLETCEPMVMKKTTLPANQKGIIDWVIEHKEIARVDNVHHDQPWKDIYLKVLEQTISELDVPILDDNQVIGVINFESASEAAFRVEDEQFLKTLAGQAMLAIQKAQAYEREKRSAKRFRLLYEAGKDLGKLTEPEDILQAYEMTLRLAQELSQTPVVLRRYDEASQQLVLALATAHRHSPPSQIIDLDESFNGWVARYQETLVTDDIFHYPAEHSHLPVDPTIRSLLITPIKFLDRYYGNLELSSDIIGHFRDKDQEFFEGLAQQLASTLYRLEITQKRQQAEIMGLVGQSTFEITHRLDQDLGLIGHKIQQINSELERQRVWSSPVTEKLDYIANAVTNVLKLGENLKSELKAGWGNEPAISLPPKVLLEDALHAVSLPDTIDVHIEIELHLGMVRVRQQLIVDALRDLITNAKDAMPNGGMLTLRAFTQGRSVAIEVTDTGPGIPQEKRAKIFELFYSTKQRSSGFGLWSALFNARRHGGNLIVSSEEGRGATFTLLLPQSEGYTV